MVPLLLSFESTLPLSSFFGLRSLFACVRKILSPQTIGVELPGNSSAIFHFTFSFADHLSREVRLARVALPGRPAPRRPVVGASGDGESEGGERAQGHGAMRSASNNAPGWEWWRVE